jgi:hypothetical protein
MFCLRTVLQAAARIMLCHDMCEHWGRNTSYCTQLRYLGKTRRHTMFSTRWLGPRIGSHCAWKRERCAPLQRGLELLSKRMCSCLFLGTVQPRSGICSQFFLSFFVVGSLEGRLDVFSTFSHWIHLLPKVARMAPQKKYLTCCGGYFVSIFVWSHA